MECFLCELFDTPNTLFIKHLDSLFDLNAKKLLYSRLYAHPSLLFNLTFIYCWEKCFSTIPSKIECFDALHNFLPKENIYNHIQNLVQNNIADHQSYISQLIYKYISQNTFIKYIPEINNNKEIIIASTTKYFQKMYLCAKGYESRDNVNFFEENILFTHNEIKSKLKKRIYPWIQIIKNERFNDNENLTLYEYYTKLIQYNGKVHDFYQECRKQILENDLLYKNVFTGFIIFPGYQILEQIKFDEWTCLNPVECINFQITHDFYFQRMLYRKNLLVFYKSQNKKKEEHELDNGEEMKEDMEEDSDIMTSIFLKITKSCLESVFVLGSKVVFDFIETHKENESDSPFRYDHNIFNACVPRIAGFMIWINEQNNLTPTQEKLEIQPKSLNSINVCFSFSDTSEHEGYRHIVIVKDYPEVLKLPLNTELIPFFINEKNAYPLILNDLECEISSPSPYARDFKMLTHITDDFIKGYFNMLTAVQMREQLFTKTLMIAKNLILRYVVQNDISIHKITDAFNESFERKRKFSAKKHCLFYLDTRKNISGIYSLIITLYNLNLNASDFKWEIVILTLDSYRTFYTHYLGPYVKFISHSLVKKDTSFSIDTYNRILKSEELWTSLQDLHYDKCLIIQDDSMLFRKGVEEMFFKFDYVGPPWLKCQSNAELKQYVGDSFIGNGGLSLRNVGAMLAICQKYQNEKNFLFNGRLQPIQEDVYFSMCSLKENLKLPTYMEASFFGIEQVYNSKALGVHKFWVYNDKSKVIDYFISLQREHKHR